MTTELRTGEELVRCAGGECCVCKQRIQPGFAVQISRYSNYLRHPSCMPKSDGRKRKRGVNQNNRRHWTKFLSHFHQRQRRAEP